MAAQYVGPKLKSLQEGVYIQGTSGEGVWREARLGLPVAAVVDKQGLVVREHTNDTLRGLSPVLEAAQDAVCRCVTGSKGGAVRGCRFGNCGGRGAWSTKHSQSLTQKDDRFLGTRLAIG